jgi:hypothetical protein
MAASPVEGISLLAPVADRPPLRQWHLAFRDAVSDASAPFTIERIADIANIQAVLVQPEGRTPRQLILDLLLLNRGTALGWFHTDTESDVQERFVVDTLRDPRVEPGSDDDTHINLTQIFVELPLSAQRALDAGGPALRDYIASLPEPVQRWGLIPIVEAAHARGIRVVAMDVEGPYTEPGLAEMKRAEREARLTGANPHWANVIREVMRHQRPNARYLVCGGVAHFGVIPEDVGRTGASGTQPPRLPGVDYLLGIPSMHFFPPRGLARMNFNYPDPYNVLVGALPENIEIGQVIRGAAYLPGGGVSLWANRLPLAPTGHYIARID